MVSTSFYLDCRAVQAGKPAPLKFVIRKNGKAAYLNMTLSLLPSEWDKDAQKVVRNLRRALLNNNINQRKVNMDAMILDLVALGLYESHVYEDTREDENNPTEFGEACKTIDVETSLVPYMIDDLDDKVNTAVTATGGPVWSKREGIMFVGNADRVDEVLKEIEDGDDEMKKKIPEGE